jgi:hypothetical protein
VHGRDKYFRPTLVLDLDAALKVMEVHPTLITAENVLEAFVYLWNYIKKVMFLDGHIEQWIGIFNFA